MASCLTLQNRELGHDLRQDYRFLAGLDHDLQQDNGLPVGPYLEQPWDKRFLAGLDHDLRQDNGLLVGPD